MTYRGAIGTYEEAVVVASTLKTVFLFAVILCLLEQKKNNHIMTLHFRQMSRVNATAPEGRAMNRALLLQFDVLLSIATLLFRLEALFPNRAGLQ